MPGMQFSSFLSCLCPAAAWCGPCKIVGPVFDKLSAKYASSIVFLKVLCCLVLIRPSCSPALTVHHSLQNRRQLALQVDIDSNQV